MQAVDEIFQEFDVSGAAGCAVGVFRGGEIEYASGYGLANLENRIPFRTSTVGNLGSMAKQFTGMLIALLDDDGTISLDDDIRLHLPELHDFDRRIRVRHLVHHSSGLRGTYPDLFLLGGWGMTDRMTTDDVLRLMSAQRELNYEPGEEFLYINSGYTLLALIAERAAGEGFASLTRSRIFDPLGMKSTFVLDDPATVVPDAAGGYFEVAHGSWRRAIVTDSVMGSTNVWSTIEDLACWDRNFVTGEVGATVVARIQEPGTLNDGSAPGYAFGLEAAPSNRYRGRRAVEHGGQHGGHCAHMIRFPEAHLSVAVMFNRFLWDAREYALRVADLYLDDQGGAASPPKAAAALGRSEDSEAQRFAGTYFNESRAALRTVEFDDGRLTYEGLPLTGIRPDRFVVDADPTVEVLFGEDGDGKFAETDTPSGRYRYWHVDPPATDAASLEELVGIYESEELSVRWAVVAAAGSLLVRRPRFPDTTLTPVFEDGFIDDWEPIAGFPFSFMIRFDRNPAGTVVGCRVSGDRARNLRFKRSAGWL